MIDLRVDLVCRWCRLNHARLDKVRVVLAAEGVTFDVARLRFERIAFECQPGSPKA